MEYTNCKWCGSTIFAGVARCPNCGKDAAGVVLAADAQAEPAPSTAKQENDPTSVPAKQQFDFAIKFVMYAIPVVAVSLVIWKIYPIYMAISSSMPAPTSESAVSAVVKELNSPDKEKRYQACLALSGQDHLPADGLPIVQRLLKDPEENVRGSCGAAIGSYGAAAREAIPVLVSMLHDPSSYARMTAAESLGKIAARIPEDTLAVPALADAMKDKDEQVRRFTAAGLQAMGDRAAPAIPALLVAFSVPSAKDLAGVRAQILQTLGTLVAKSADIFPVITRALRDANVDVRLRAIQALRDSCPLARTAMPDLVQMLHDKDDTVRIEAVHAIDTCCADVGESLASSVQVLCQRNVSLADPSSIPR